MQKFQNNEVINQDKRKIFSQGNGIQIGKENYQDGEKKSQNDSYPTKLLTTKPTGRRQRTLGKKKRIDRSLRFVTLVKFLG